jgi:phenylpropionate dioxygenase-like ring-hydroxylating dioxygenase large terminal subunit
MSAPEYRLIAKTGSPEQLVQSDRVDVSLYHDPALFEAELEKIFYRTWVWVAHDSEVRNPGDFKTTMIGRRPVIVVRDKKGQVNVLENRCRHRGATVCEKHKGNATGFTCPYHSWSYGLDGKLRALPYPDGYEDILDKAELPLTSLRVESYAGMIFASYDADIEPLEDFLGGA